MIFHAALLQLARDSANFCTTWINSIDTIEQKHAFIFFGGIYFLTYSKKIIISGIYKIVFTVICHVLGFKGAEALAFVLKESKLAVLDLRLNSIGRLGGQYLINVCTKEAVYLKQLYISGCGLTSENENIGKMIAFNETLEVLDMSNNKLGEVFDWLIIVV